jgi:polyisoprenyl-teichoic acid--peptidoglycan teichoic acid transferase
MATTADDDILVSVRPRNPWIAAVLSIIVPGLGHVYCRRFIAGLLWFGLVAATAVATIIVAPGIRDIANAAFSPTVLWTVFFANIAAAIWRVACAIDAYRVAGGFAPAWTTAFAAVGLVVVAAVIAVPHFMVGELTYDAIRLVDIAFDSGDGPPVTPVIPIGTDADIVPDPVVTRYEVASVSQTRMRGRIFEPGFGDPDATAAWESEASARLEAARPSPFLPFTERVGTDRITILLAGGDAGPGRGGMRTDTMMVATIDPVTGKAALFGFPRNFGRMPLPANWSKAFVDLELKMNARAVAESGTTTTLPPEGVTTTTAPFESCECFPEQLNALYPFTRKWTGTYPDEADPGMAALRDVLSVATGLRIDYYALVDMAAFVDLVGAIGGVDVFVQAPLQAEVSPPREGDPWAKVDVDVGWHHLNGPEALAYVRARHGSSDYVRMQRQRCMLRAVASKSTPFTLLRGFGDIVDALEGSLVTDIPVSFAPDLLSMAANLDFSDVATFGFQPGQYAPDWDNFNHPVPDIDRIREKVASVIRDQESGVEATGDAVGTECDAEL